MDTNAPKSEKIVPCDFFAVVWPGRRQAIIFYGRRTSKYEYNWCNQHEPYVPVLVEVCTVGSRTLL